MRASACVSEPLPVPDSTTTLPGRSSSSISTIAMSAAYRICVRWGSETVHSSGVACSIVMKPSPFVSGTDSPYLAPAQR